MVLVLLYHPDTATLPTAFYKYATAYCIAVNVVLLHVVFVAGGRGTNPRQHVSLKVFAIYHSLASL